MAKTPLRLMRYRVLWIVALLIMSTGIYAQSTEYAATLEVLNAGVTVQRVNTANPIAVSVEAIVGVGDVIRTDDTGRARITFFADGTDVTLEPDSEYRIVEFSGNDTDFTLVVNVILGQVTHRLNRTLGALSSYDVETPGMTLAARGTVFVIRVEDNGRSAMLVTEGTVDASEGDESASVPEEFGIRSPVGEALSEVVRASTFAELDSALDGCTASVTTPDDVSINVRLGPDTAQPRVGTIDPNDITLFYGVLPASGTGGRWYRIAFSGGFGWILSSTASVDTVCAGLRAFDATHTEDASLYQGVTLETPPATPTPDAPDTETDTTGGDDPDGTDE